MRLAISGATGLVGRFVVEEALAAGDQVLSLSRHAPPPGFFATPVSHADFHLAGTPPALAGCDALIHLAFQHQPGRYRGGEGNDPDGFRKANIDGSRMLFEAARTAGVGRVLFLSSRAVYGAYAPGTLLTEDMPSHPDTLYGVVKHAAEQALSALHGPGFATASLRSTGVYGPAGPGQRHKWCSLFEDFLAGRPVHPRIATEVHGADLAAAVRCLLVAPPEQLNGRVFNVSDILLDRRDLLAGVAQATGSTSLLPPRADASQVSVMACERLRGLGWRPGGFERLSASLPQMGLSPP